MLSHHGAATSNAATPIAAASTPALSPSSTVQLHLTDVSLPPPSPMEQQARAAQLIVQNVTKNIRAVCSSSGGMSSSLTFHHLNRGRRSSNSIGSSVRSGGGSTTLGTVPMSMSPRMLSTRSTEGRSSGLGNNNSNCSGSELPPSSQHGSSSSALVSQGESLLHSYRGGGSNHHRQQLRRSAHSRTTVSGTSGEGDGDGGDDDDDTTAGALKEGRRSQTSSSGESDDGSQSSACSTGGQHQTTTTIRTQQNKGDGEPRDSVAVQHGATAQRRGGGDGDAGGGSSGDVLLRVGGTSSLLRVTRPSPTATTNPGGSGGVKAGNSSSSPLPEEIVHPRDVSAFDGIYRAPKSEGAYRKLHLLGTGSFGETWLVEWVPASQYQSHRYRSIPSPMSSVVAIHNTATSGAGVGGRQQHRSSSEASLSQDRSGGGAVQASTESYLVPQQDGRCDSAASSACVGGYCGGGSSSASSRRASSAAAAMVRAATGIIIQQQQQGQRSSPRHSSRARMSSTQAELADITGEVEGGVKSGSASGFRFASSAATTDGRNIIVSPHSAASQVIGDEPVGSSSSAHAVGRVGSEETHIWNEQSAADGGVDGTVSSHSVSLPLPQETPPKQQQQQRRAEQSVPPSGVSDLASTSQTIVLKNGRKVPSDRCFVCKVETRKRAQEKLHIGSGVMAEQRILASCAHPCIVAYVDEFSTRTHDCLVMEYVDGGGDLRSEIRRRRKTRRYNHFTGRSIIFLFVQLMMALEYLHRHNILHRDLKTTNILFSKKWNVKLADFGLAKQFEFDVDNDVSSTGLGTPYYMAPEVITRRSYSEKADIWSAGIILYELITLERPFPFENIRQLAKLVSTESLPEIERGDISESLKELLFSLVRKNPRDRPSAREVLQMPLMREAMADVVHSYESAARRSHNPVDAVWADVLLGHSQLILNDSRSSPKSGAAIRAERGAVMQARLQQSVTTSTNANTISAFSSISVSESFRFVPTAGDVTASDATSDASSPLLASEKKKRSTEDTGV